LQISSGGNDKLGGDEEALRPVERLRQVRKLVSSLASYCVPRRRSQQKTELCASARSAADFVAKLGIVLEEADETLFWLELLVDAGIVAPDKISVTLNEANELVAIFVAALRTDKGPKPAI
jgi:hypothetical protein